MLYKFYYYTANPDADYDTEFEDSNIKTESVDLDNDAAAILYAAEVVADMRDEEADFIDSVDAELYLDDLDLGDDSGFCIAIQTPAGDNVYGDISVINAYLNPDIEESYDPREKTIVESTVPYAQGRDYINNNVDNDYDKIWDFATKKALYVDDVTDIPNSVDGQKIRYRFSSGRNMEIDVYSDAYQEHVFIKLPKADINEDTVKQGNYWVNKGKEGTHGKFKTKKGADAQRKAMFAQGFNEGLYESIDDEEDEVDVEDLLDDMAALQSEYEGFLAALSKIEGADKGLNESLDYSKLEALTRDVKDFEYPIGIINENPCIFDISNIEIMDKHLEGDEPYIDVMVEETPEIGNRNDEDIIRDWDTNYGSQSKDSESRILTGLEYTLNTLHPKSPREYFVDCIETDPDGNRYRIERVGNDYSGTISVVTDVDIPANLSSWPGEPAEYEDHIEMSKNFRIIYMYRITKLK